MISPDGTRTSAIVFDLDGVLVDSTAVVERAWRRWAQEQGIDAAELLAVAHGRPGRELVRAFAPGLDAAAEARRLDDWEVEDSAGLEVVPGARECVALAQRGRWAVATSGGRELATGRLRAVALPVPETLVTADDVERGKPDPEPYRRAGELLGVAPAECVVVEDAPAGIAAAKSAGMVVLAVTTSHAADALQQADAVLDSMHAVERALRRL